MAKLNAEQIAALSTMDAVLTALAAKSITMEQAKARLEELEKPAKYAGITLKVSPKGGISVYGLQRMPVTLYVDQWKRFFASLGIDLPKMFVDFIKANEGKFSSKNTAAE